MKNVWDTFVALAMAKELLVASGTLNPEADCANLLLEEHPLLNEMTPPQIIQAPPNKEESGSFDKLPSIKRFLYYAGTAKGTSGQSFDVDTDGAFAALRYFQGPDFDLQAIEGYLSLQEGKQTAFAALATDKDLRRTALYALSYLATQIIMEKTYSADTAEKAADVFNSEICGKVSCGKIVPELFAVYASDLFGNAPSDGHMDTFFSMGDYVFPTLKRFLPFLHFAILGGFSAWHRQGFTTTQILLEEPIVKKRFWFVDALCTMTHPNLVNTVLAEMADAFSQYPQHEQTLSHSFFLILSRCKCLTLDTIHRMSDILFRDTIYQDQAQHMHKVLDGPNGEHFRQYIMENYSKSCENGTAEFQFCAAAICNAERHRAGQNALDAAVAGIASADTPHDYLLNVMCLGLLAWDGRIESKNYTASLRKLHLDTGTVDKLLAHLSAPDKLFFPIIACTVHDLILTDVLNPEILGKPQWIAALQALEDEDTRKRAEELLAVMQLPDPEQAAKPGTELLKANYLERYEACHRDPKSEENCEVLFAVLCHLGSFPTPAERQTQLDRIILRALEKNVYTDAASKWRTGNLLRSVGLFPPLWTDYSTQIDPSLFGQTLSAHRNAELIDLSKQLAAKNRQYRVTDTREALEILQLIGAYGSRPQQQAVPVSLSKHILMDLPNAGSYIIVKWFGTLCKYGNPEDVLSYYRRHREVLDRPKSVLFRHSQGDVRSIYEAYTAMKRSKSRVLAGLLDAVASGNTAVISAFMRSEYRSLVDNQAFVDLFITKDRLSGMEELFTIYEGKYGTDSALERIRDKRSVPDTTLQKLLEDLDRKIAELEGKPPEPPQPAPLPMELNVFPCDYYDDLTVQLHVLTAYPHLSSWVIQCGHADNYRLVKLAVTENGRNLRYASEALRANRDILSAAICQSHDTKTIPAAVLWASPALKDDKELMLQAIKANPRAYTYISSRLREDPDILALAHEDMATSMDDFAAHIQSLIDSV